MEFDKQGTIPRMPRTEQESDRLIALAEVDSTNRQARLWAREGAPDGAVVVAARQTAGRRSVKAKQ